MTKRSNAPGSQASRQLTLNETTEAGRLVVSLCRCDAKPHRQALLLELVQTFADAGHGGAESLLHQVKQEGVGVLT